MKIAFVGFGEAARAFVSGWGDARPGEILTYDIKLDAPATAGDLRDAAKALGVRLCASAAEALAEADLVFSTVTADQAVIAAKAGARHLCQGAAWLDLNSCAPGSKRLSQGVIEAAGGRYLDVAVMAPVHPRRNLVPCLISGPHAADLAPVLAALPMAVRVVPGEVGRASSIKMIRSIMVKGLEALTAECVLAAVAAGVAEEVLPSLLEGHPKLDVAERATYNFERSLVHGERRAAEMDEVAVTLADLGLPNGMSASAADWQRRIARSGVSLPEGDGYEDFALPLLKALRKGD